jgi:hypothetical protein
VHVSHGTLTLRYHSQAVYAEKTLPVKTQVFQGKMESRHVVTLQGTHGNECGERCTARFPTHPVCAFHYVLSQTIPEYVTIGPVCVTAIENSCLAIIMDVVVGEKIIAVAITDSNTSPRVSVYLVPLINALLGRIAEVEATSARHFCRITINLAMLHHNSS